MIKPGKHETPVAIITWVSKIISKTAIFIKRSQSSLEKRTLNGLESSFKPVILLKCLESIWSVSSSSKIHHIQDLSPERKPFSCGVTAYVVVQSLSHIHFYTQTAACQALCLHTPEFAQTPVHWWCHLTIKQRQLRWPCDCLSAVDNTWK